MRKYLFLLGVVSFLGNIFLSGDTKANLSFDEFYLKHSSVILIIEPKSGRVIDSNYAASNFYGFKRTELKTKTIQDINALTKEEVAQERQRAKEENRNFFIFRHRLKNGDVKTVEVHSNPYEYKGKTVLISIIHDISKQREIQNDLWHYQSQLEQMVDRQTEQLKETHAWTVGLLVGGIIVLFILIVALIYTNKKLKVANTVVANERQQLDEIIWSTNVGTWEWNVQTGEVIINDKFAEIIGYTVSDLEPINLKTWTSNTHPEDLVEAQELINRTFTRENDHYETEFRMKHKNDSYVWISSKGNIVEWGDDGTPLRMAGTHADISRKKAIEEKLHQATKVAEEANLAKSEFLATISHELRTPMTGIRGVLELLRDNKTVSNAEGDLLDDLDVSSRTLMSLLDDILDLSKIEAGQLELDVDAWEPAKIVENIVSLYRPNALKNNVDLSTNANRYMNYWCKTDDIRLRQILSNLVSNAIKFTDEGAVDVLMHIEMGENEDRLVIEVHDTGIGIAKDKQKLIFNRFAQADQSTTKAFGGTGLGLAIANELAEMMGGHLNVKSKLGKGSTFTLTLPVQWTEKKMPVSVKKPEKMRPLRVLMAEDNLVNQKIVSSMLMNNGHTVDIAHNGLEALDLIENQKFDIVLMDIQMPQMDGVEATELIRNAGKDYSSVPIIAFTADAVREHRQRFLDVGIDEIVNKPVKFESLYNVMEKLID